MAVARGEVAYIGNGGFRGKICLFRVMAVMRGEAARTVLSSRSCRAPRGMHVPSVRM